MLELSEKRYTIPVVLLDKVVNNNGSAMAFFVLPFIYNPLIEILQFDWARRYNP
jgi:hypothetical protein